MAGFEVSTEGSALQLKSGQHVAGMGLGRVELPTSRLSGCLVESFKSGKLLENLDIPRDLHPNAGRTPENVGGA